MEPPVQYISIVRNSVMFMEVSYVTKNTDIEMILAIIEKNKAYCSILFPYLRSYSYFSKYFILLLLLYNFIVNLMISQESY